MTDKANAGRCLLVGLLLLLAFTGLGFRLVSLHLLQSADLRAELEGSRHVREKLDVVRGRIYDRNGGANVLAMDLLLKDVIADPQRIIDNGEVEHIATRLQEVLEMDPADIMSRLDRPGRRFQPITKCLSDEEAKRVRELNLDGIYFREVSSRHYPQESFMCHVIGFVNHEAVGSSGVEQTMNRFLCGCSGYRESKVDGRRRELYYKRIQDIAPRDGSDVYLTIDQHVQYIVERALDQVVEKYSPAGACAIVQRIRTGEILAMASRPAYDLNHFNEASEAQLLNRAIGQVYEPGSTMKIITLAAVLSEKTATPNDEIFCENGAWLHEGRILQDYSPHGSLTVADVLKKSSNIGIAKLALRLGAEKLEEYLRRFQIGSSLGIDLPGEENGILHPVRKWSKLSCSRIAIGQGVAVTPLQMLNAACAIANDGVMMRPYVICQVLEQDGTLRYRATPQQISRVVDKETADEMRRLLARVTEPGGTGTRARVDNFTVAGKTGTAQKPVRGGYSETDNMASFVGFLPAEEPELGIIVVVDSPQPLHTGGVVAAPVFSEIACKTVRYLDVCQPSLDRTVVASRN